MGIILVSKGESGDDEHLKNLIEYIADDRKLLIGGNGVNYNDAKTAFDQMDYVRTYYDKKHECPLAQVIVAYDESITDAETACDYTKQAVSFFSDEYQRIECVHEADRDCGNYHAHILLNPVNLKTGKQLDTNKEYVNQFSEYVSEITGTKNKVLFKKREKE